MFPRIMVEGYRVCSYSSSSIERTRGPQINYRVDHHSSLGLVVLP